MKIKTKRCFGSNHVKPALALIQNEWWQTALHWRRFYSDWNLDLHGEKFEFTTFMKKSMSGRLRILANLMNLRDNYGVIWFMEIYDNPCEMFNLCRVIMRSVFTWIRSIAGLWRPSQKGAARWQCQLLSQGRGRSWNIRGAKVIHDFIILQDNNRLLNPPPKKQKKKKEKKTITTTVTTTNIILEQLSWCQGSQDAENQKKEPQGVVNL